MSGRYLLLVRIRIYFIAIRIFSSTEIIIEWEIFSLFSSNISLVIILDFMSLFFFRLVCLISGSVILFSTSYIKDEIYFSRFIILVILFVFSILLLIASPNIISLLLGWDGLGVTSYLLVIFYQRNKSHNAGLITALTNRLGDVGLLIRIGIMLLNGSWRFVFYTNFSSYWRSTLISIIIFAACTKRAQIPFSAWLPAAIAAPTPVSALVHSSTLVTAGVYVLIRFNSLLVGHVSLLILIYLGAVTILIAGIAAIKEIDIKKIIALSTLSQLGVIIIVLGIGIPLLAFFHLLSHAYFKAILFICAGIIIHNIKDYQDLRVIGARMIRLPLINAIIISANLSLCGIPFIRGFYSKDLILEIILIGGVGGVLFIIIRLGTALTVAYSCRLAFTLGSRVIRLERGFHIEEIDLFMPLGIIILFPFAVWGGILLRWITIRSPGLVFLPLWLKRLILVLIFLSLLTSWIKFNLRSSSKPSFTLWFLANMWFIPLSFRYTFSNFFISRGLLIQKSAELTWTELTLYKKLRIILFKIGKYVDYFSSISFLGVLFIFAGTLIWF